MSYTEASSASDMTGVLEDEESTNEAVLLSRLRPACQLRLGEWNGGVLLLEGGPELGLSLLDSELKSASFRSPLLSSSPCRYWQISSGSLCSSASISFSNWECI